VLFSFKSPRCKNAPAIIAEAFSSDLNSKINDGHHTGAQSPYLLQHWQHAEHVDDKRLRGLEQALVQHKLPAEPGLLQ
jgi:hypothetical protein